MSDLLDIRIKRLHPEAKIPKYAFPSDGAMDLYVTSVHQEGEFQNRMWVCGTGIAMEIPVGYVGLVFPRSSISKTDLFQRNAVGVIDSSYRGEITVKFGFYGNGKDKYDVGDRCGQIMIIPRPQVVFTEVDSLSSTDRGSGGYGSTGV